MNDVTMTDDIIRRCMAVRTLSAARALARRYDAALRPAGLTGTQFTLLVSIAQSRPQSITQIAEQLFMERSSLTRSAKLLEREGLLERRDEGGARKRALRITPKGRSRLRKAYPLWKKVQEETEAYLGDALKDTKQILRLLRTVPPQSETA